MLESVRCRIPVDLILGFKDLPELKTVPQDRPINAHTHEAHDHVNEQREILSAVPDNSSVLTDKSHDLVFESWSFTSDRPFKKKALKEMLKNISPDIIRAKGFVYWDDPKDPLVLFNLVGNWIDFEVYFKKEDLPFKTRLVFIGNPGWKKHSNFEHQLIKCTNNKNTPDN